MSVQPQDMIVRPSVYRAGRFEFPLGARTYIMGILNITPDSFSDGGRYFGLDEAMRHAGQLLKDGADILDIGGESTRPGSVPVGYEVEMSRVIPVIEKIKKEFACPISIDTYKSEVAEAALAAGACMVNDINGLQADSGMADVIARHKSGVILMHNARIYRREGEIYSSGQGIMTDVIAFLKESCRIAADAGIPPENIILDPGVGFGVTSEESIEMIARLNELHTIGLPLLLGPSRKRFIKHILGQTSSSPLSGTCASAVMGITRGVDFVRVHDVKEIAEVARMADAIERAGLSARRWRQ